MTLQQFVLSCASQQDAESAVNALDDGFPEAFSSISYVRADGDEWHINAIGEGQLPDLDAVETCVKRHVTDIRVEDVPDRDWITHTLSNLAPVHAGTFVVHGSHDRPFFNINHVGILIDAGLAFGTGHHETTRGCLQLLSDVVKKREVLSACDIGSGTGVLAIAYALKTRCPVLATDIDPIAVDVARENATKNNAAPFLHFAIANGTQHLAIAERAPYDLIFANILAQPLRRMAHDIRRVSSRRTGLILSGLLKEQEAGVLSAYRQVGFYLKKKCHLGDWSSLYLVRSHRYS